MSHNITVEGGKAIRLKTSGKYCDRDIVVTSTGGSEDLTEELTAQDSLIEQIESALSGKAAGGGGVEVFYTKNGGCYVKDMVIEPYDKIYNESSFANRYQYATELETVEIPNIVLSGSVASVFAFCSKLKKAFCPKITNYGHYWFRNCTALEEAQLGSIGYPVTKMTTLVFSGDTQTNLTITIYVAAMTLAEIVTDISNNAPFGAKNATIIYRNSTTGEVLE